MDGIPEKATSGLVGDRVIKVGQECVVARETMHRGENEVMEVACHGILTHVG